MWSILLVDIRLVWILKLHILTFNFVLCNSKWGHSPICQYCFKATSATPSVPLQFKGELRERWVQLAEISQNKLSYKYCTMLKHHSSFADRGMTLSCDPCTPARCIKTPGWRITFSLTHRWSKTETLLEKKKKKKTPRADSVGFCTHQRKTELQQSKRRISSFKNNSRFSKGDHSWHTIAENLFSLRLPHSFSLPVVNVNLEGHWSSH